ncbi:MAG: hypothetical protein SBU_001587 [Candidatus Syntrophoarchaeum butanivorans]|uniref:Uncharacterized protein n=1 Tax=Candidatus Syntropharchaeum butanivorans TaxID=1839936 RepID=A0A1F2P3C7_9EURY|nr:MAG: hypothetical protein SBU_001587 [Candidatus Syntrophoarchaeum butanivorans]
MSAKRRGDEAVSITVSAILLTAVVFTLLFVTYQWGIDILGWGEGSVNRGIHERELGLLEDAIEEVTHEGYLSSRSLFITAPLTLDEEKITVSYENGSYELKNPRIALEEGPYIEFPPSIYREGSDLIIIERSIELSGTSERKVIVKNAGTTCSLRVNKTDIQIGEPINATYENVSLAIYTTKVVVG